MYHSKLKKSEIYSKCGWQHICCAKNATLSIKKFFLSDLLESMIGGETFCTYGMKYQQHFNIFEKEISTFIAFGANIEKKYFLKILRHSEATIFFLPQ